MALPSASSALSLALDDSDAGFPRAVPSSGGVVRLSRAAPADAARSTRAEINLAHVRHNLHELKAVLSDSASDGTAPKIWAVKLKK